MILKHQITSFPNNGFTEGGSRKGKTLTFLCYMWCRWWGIMIPGCVWEYSSLEKWWASNPPPQLWLRRTHWTQQMIMIFRKRREGWACDEYFIYFNGLRKRRKMSGFSEAKHGLSLQTSSIANKDGGAPDEAGPIPGRGQRGQQCSACLLWVTVIGIHLRTSVAVSASPASWQVADLQSCLMIHIGVRAGEHEEMHKRYLAFSQAQCGRAGSFNELAYSVELTSWPLKIDYYPFRKKHHLGFRQQLYR